MYYTLPIHNKDDIELVTEFPCLGQPLSADQNWMLMKL